MVLMRYGSLYVPLDADKQIKNNSESVKKTRIFIFL